jgi:MarR family transcriptional regulator, organic hydroperoxide resistance regulator
MARAPDLRDVFSELVLFETQLRGAIDARLRSECEIPLNQFELLGAVEACDPCQVRDIAAGLALTTGGTSKLLDRAEAAGLCSRAPNPDDRRSSIVNLTPDGRAALSAGTVVLQAELEARLAAALSPALLRQFSEALTRLSRA